MAIKINYFDEYSKLKQIALYRPEYDEIEQNSITRAMYREIPDRNKVLQEFDGIVSKFEQLGISVLVVKSEKDSAKTPNMIYLRDVAFVYGQSMVLAKMKHAIRSKEPEKFRELLSKIAPEISLMTSMVSQGTLEGADLLLNKDGSLLAYTGSRTSTAAVEEVRQKFKVTKIYDIPANISDIPQHLLGGIHIVDNGLITRRTKHCNYPIIGYEYINFTENSEITNGLALNIVTIGPKEIIMPAKRPETRKKLEKRGIKCHEVNIDEIHKMGGGLACMVLPLYRESS